MGVARNVSAGGAFIETDLHLLPGEQMTITFELLGRPFKLHAEVVRVMEAGFGVRFYVDLSAAGPPSARRSPDCKEKHAPLARSVAGEASAWECLPRTQRHSIAA